MEARGAEKGDRAEADSRFVSGDEQRVETATAGANGWMGIPDEARALEANVRDSTGALRRESTAATVFLQ